MKSQKNRAPLAHSRFVGISRLLVLAAGVALLCTLAAIVFPAHAALSGASAAPRPAPVSAFAPDKGKFRILANGALVGAEEYEIAPSGGDWIVRGSSDIHTAQGAPQHVTGTLELRPDGSPVRYEWTTGGDSKASSTVTFNGATAFLEPHTAGAFPVTQQLSFNSQPVVVLDDNLYEQYTVLARLYDWTKKGVQTFSVLVPQETTGGNVTVESLGAQDAAGKKLEELRVKTEDNEIDLYLDGSRLVRIAAPAAKAEIIRE